MSLEVERATEKVRRADKAWRISKGLFGLYLAVAVSIVMIQGFISLDSQQKALDKSIQDNAQQHDQTQEYIRCVATALLLPLAQRSESVFDKCGIETGVSVAPMPNQPGPVAQSEPTAQALPAPAPSTATPTTPQPTTSSPPDPDVAPAPVQYRGFVLNLLDGVLDPVRSLIGNQRG